MPKKTKARWFKVAAIEKGAKIADHGKDEFYVVQRFYDESGERMLTAVKTDAEGIPTAAMRRISQALELAELAPTLVLGPHTDFVRLVELSEIESRRHEDERLRALSELKGSRPS